MTPPATPSAQSFATRPEREGRDRVATALDTTVVDVRPRRSDRAEPEQEAS